MFIETLLTKPKFTKPKTTLIPINCYVYKQNVIYPYHAILFCHRNEILIHAKIWIILENVMLSKRSKTQKGHKLYDSII